MYNVRQESEYSQAYQSSNQYVLKQRDERVLQSLVGMFAEIRGKSPQRCAHPIRTHFPEPLSLFENEPPPTQHGLLKRFQMESTWTSNIIKESSALIQEIQFIIQICKGLVKVW